MYTHLTTIDRFAQLFSLVAGAMTLHLIPNLGTAMTTMTTQQPVQKLNPIVIDWFAAEDTIEVTGQDTRRFKVQKDVAIKVLRAVQDKGRAFSQIDLLLERIGRWTSERREKLRDIYLTVQDSSFLLVLVQQAARHDDELEEALSELDVEIANDPDFELLKLNAILLPPVTEDALMSFLDPRFLLSYDGKRTEPRGAGKSESSTSRRTHRSSKT